METAGIIKISETQEAELSATSARLHLNITGENFIYGNAALEKSLEVKNLVEELKRFGATDADFAVKSVSVKTETGFFAKSSKGDYKITALVKDLSALSNFLGVIAIQKNARLDSLEWIFDEDETRLELARQALLKAKRKADLMAEAVGYKIIGIRTCSDSFAAPVDVQNLNFQSDLMSQGIQRTRAASFAPAADIGTQFRGEKTVTAQVMVEFVVVKADS